MFARVATLVLILAYLHRASSFDNVLVPASIIDSRNLVFVIVSQAEPYHASVASRLRQHIENQVFDIEKRRPNVHITHEDFRIPGAWTVMPLFRPLVNKYKGSDVRWVLFIEAHTAVTCSKLLEALNAADRQGDTMWIGYPLSDEEPTIIHHFAIYDDLDDEGGFVYPNFASGFAMRMGLIETLVKRTESDDTKTEMNFSIDPSFELAQLVYGDKANPGPLLTADLSFCIVSGENCATYPRQFDICGSPVPEESIFFAVKTWSEFHDTRAKVVKKTWGKHVTNIAFYSDKSDPSIPTIDTGIPNTKQGHCAKTVAILKLAVNSAQNLPHVKWIFLADDDTIIGVQRLCEVLSCYRGGDDLTVLGERYGYGYTNVKYIDKGFDYITGGGGTALSVGAARKLARTVCGVTAHDDMVLGAYARSANLTLTHSPLFHQLWKKSNRYLDFVLSPTDIEKFLKEAPDSQYVATKARPQDYPRELLARDRPVSFHRHSSPDPVRVYATWFQHDDLAIKQRRRDEL